MGWTFIFFKLNRCLLNVYNGWTSVLYRRKSILQKPARTHFTIIFTSEYKISCFKGAYFNFTHLLFFSLDWIEGKCKKHRSYIAMKLFFIVVDYISGRPHTTETLVSACALYSCGLLECISSIYLSCIICLSTVMQDEIRVWAYEHCDTHRKARTSNSHYIKRHVRLFDIRITCIGFYSNLFMDQISWYWFRGLRYKFSFFFFFLIFWIQSN